ncbi:flagellar hook-length control protein [Betaproteobacteria bacterium]|nr:flagellar hook-length control protein [Betaproteobacteria bacterium]
MPITIVSALPKSAPSAPSSTANAVTGTENPDSAQDFSKLLRGQLTAAQSVLMTTPESAANDSVGGGRNDGNAEFGGLALLAMLAQASLEQRGQVDDENAESGDSLALLAALEQQGKIALDEFNAKDSVSGGQDTDDENAESGDPALLATLAQASLEQRGKVASDAVMEDKSPLATGVSAQVSPKDEMLAERMARSAAQASADRMRAPANEQAAKFAADFAISPDKISGKNAVDTQESSGLSTLTTVAAGAPSRQDNASPTIPIPTSVYDRNWNNDFAQKVTWIATHNKQSAELTLNPPSMGSIEISLKLDNDKSTATAFFVSSNAEVRETIETSLPRLREMLAGAGIQLGQTQVSAESFRQSAGNGQRPWEGASPSGNDMDILAPDAQAGRITASVVGAGHGLIDMFA